MISDKLLEEARAFDARISARVENGLVPDIKNAERVDWFYNNPWRRREYVDMVFGDYLRFALRHISPNGQRILEIGSGLGHMTLELARRSHQVTGIELSPESVRIAREYTATCDKGDNFGSLEYINDDFMDWNPKEKFEIICFFLTLHHFEDPKMVLRKVSSMLKPEGRVIVIEPARDSFSYRNAAVVALIRMLLSMSGNWYNPISIPSSESEFQDVVSGILCEYREAKDKDEMQQSPNDNSTYASDMLEALQLYFDEIELSAGNTISPRLLGGIRGKSDSEVLKIAAFVKLFDDFATREELIEPGVIYFAGKLKD